MVEIEITKLFKKMIKMDNISNGLDKFETLLNTVPEKNLFVVNTIFNLTVHKDWNIPRRQIPDWHFVIILDGEGSYEICGHKVPLRRGTFALVGGRAWYAGIQNSLKPPRFIPIRFDFRNRKNNESPGILKEEVYYVGITRDVAVYEALGCELWRTVQQRARSGERDCNGRITSLLHSMLILSLKELEYDNITRVDTDRRLEDVCRWIDQHPDHRSDIAQLAKRSGISRKYFSTLFKRKYGVTPKNYLVRARMEYARWLLRDSDTSIKDIAFRLGYSDQYLFSNQFRVITGVSPKKYRQAE